MIKNDFFRLIIPNVLIASGLILARNRGWGKWRVANLQKLASKAFLILRLYVPYILLHF